MRFVSGRRVKEETFLFDGFVFSFGIDGGVGSVERVGNERRDGAENECGEVEDAGGEDVGFSGGISVVVREKRGEGVDVLEVQGVCSALVELRKMLFVGYGFHGWDRVRRFRGAAGGCLFRCLRGAG